MASTIDDSASLRIEKFKRVNFHLWKFKMQMVLEEKNLWDIVSGEEVEPEEEGNSNEMRIQRFRKRERKAFATICLSLGDEQLSLVRSAKTAKEVWEKLENHYQFDPGVKYLVKKELCIFKAETDIGSSFDESSALSDFDIEGDIEDRDSACKEISVSNSHHISFEYHVIFNESYSVPALYFQATKPDGKGLLLEEVWRMVPKLYENALEGKWSFITQIDHPILGHPVFHIHPCNTATMMGNLLTNKQNMDNYKYLLMWLSALGPLVGLRLANGFFMDNQN